MTKTVNAERGITMRADGSYRARLTYRGKNYECVTRTKADARTWRVEMMTNLPKCPREVRYSYGSWSVSIPNGARVESSKFQKFQQAMEWFTEVSRAIAHGTFSNELAQAETVDDYVKRWVDRHSRATDRTILRYWTTIRNQISPQLGHLKLQAVSPLVLRDWVAGLSEKGHSDDAIGKAIALIRSVFKAAVDEEILQRNPSLNLVKPRTPRPNREALNLEQLLELARSAGKYQAMILVMGMMGLRLGEVRALQVGDLCFDTKKIRVRRALTIDAAYRTVVGTTKTKQRREISIPEPLIEILKPHTEGRQETDWLFTGTRGSAVNDGWFRKSVFRPVVMKMGLHQVTPHNLRHTSASLLISQGTSVTAVARVLGHSTPALTLSTYAHYYDKDIDDAMAEIGDRFQAANTLARESESK